MLLNSDHIGWLNSWCHNVVPEVGFHEVHYQINWDTTISACWNLCQNQIVLSFADTYCFDYLWKEKQRERQFQWGLSKELHTAEMWDRKEPIICLFETVTGQFWDWDSESMARPFKWWGRQYSGSFILVGLLPLLLLIIREFSSGMVSLHMCCP